MLYIGNHLCRSVEVKLLYGAVTTKREQAGTWSKYGQASHVVCCRNGVKRDVLGSHIPRDRLTKSKCQYARSLLPGGGLGLGSLFRVLYDASILGPAHPVRARSVILRSLQDPYYLCRIIRRISLRHTPYSEIAVVGLNRQHIRLLSRRGCMPGQARYGRWCSVCSQVMQDGEPWLYGGNQE